MKRLFIQEVDIPFSSYRKAGAAPLTDYAVVKCVITSNIYMEENP